MTVEPAIHKEFCEDGDNIIVAFTNMTNRIKHFPSGKYEFIAIEDEIVMPIKNNVEFICYIDVVLKEKATGRYRIIDIKTSTSGWNHYQRDDEAKISQILLYKAFFSRKYNVDIDMIDVEFFILRRKLWENYAFPQSRIQTFVPKNNQHSVARALNNFAEFVTECFTSNGKFVEDVKVYLKNPEKERKTVVTAHTKALIVMRFQIYQRKNLTNKGLQFDCFCSKDRLRNRELYCFPLQKQ